jgi:hypothetical protein
MRGRSDHPDTSAALREGTITELDDAQGEETMREPDLRPRPAALRARLGREDGVRLVLVGLLIVLVGAAVGYVTSWLVKEQYAGRAEVLYTLREDQPTGFLREDRNLTTQLVVLESRTVLAPVAAAEGLSVDDLGGKLHASVAEGSEVIRIEVRDPQPQVALRLVDAVTRRYLAVANVVTDESRAYLEGQLQGVQARLDEADLPPSVRTTLTARRTDLLARLDTIALAGPQAKALAPTYATSDPVSPKRFWAAAAGALGALLIAAVVVALLARRWTRRPD